MMNFGPFSSEVHEVISFVNRGGILSGVFHPHPDCFILRDIEEIDRFRDIEWPDAMISGELNWSDVRQQAGHEYYAYSSTHPEFRNETVPLIDAAWRQLFPMLSNQLYNILPQYEIDEIANDMLIIMLRRAAIGIISGFDEYLYSFYLLNGYPCGWNGCFPDGQLVVFTKE